MMIPTFAFEIESLQSNNGQPVEGWLLNDSLKTTHYILIWPNVKCEYDGNGTCVRKTLGNLKKSDFTVIEALLINKKSIIRYLNGHGWDKEKLASFAQDIKQQGLEGKVNSDNKNFYFYYSKAIAEQPINVVIKKEILFNLAQRAYLVSADGMANIK